MVVQWQCLSAPLPHASPCETALGSGLAIWGCAECPERCVRQEAGSQQASVHRAVFKLLHPALLLVLTPDKGSWHCPMGSHLCFGFLRAFNDQQMMVVSGLGRCCLGLWHSASTDYGDYFQQLYCIDDKHSCCSYKQQETLNLLNTPWTVENLLSWITLSEEAKCKVLPCITHRSLQVTSENFPGSPMTSEGSSEGRGTFFFGHSGNLFPLTPGKEDLCVFGKYILLFVCDTTLLPDSLLLPSPFLQSWKLISFSLFSSDEKFWGL